MAVSAALDCTKPGGDIVLINFSPTGCVNLTFLECGDFIQMQDYAVGLPGNFRMVFDADCL